MKSTRALLYPSYRTSRPVRPNWLAGRRILITGASSGIGRATALLLAGYGAELVLVARREPDLRLLCKEITEAGASASYHAADLSRGEEVDELLAWIAAGGGHIDVVVNNAGRSIRRPVLESTDRFHDYERTMAINYFGAVRLTLGLLPAMRAAGSGHIVNVGTWGVGFESSPYFSAYLASKAALVAFGRCIDGELSAEGIHATAVNFPAVRTAMLAPTAKYSALPALTPEQAARWIATAIRRRPVRIEPWAVHGIRLVSLISPRTADRLLRRFGI